MNEPTIKTTSNTEEQIHTSVLLERIIAEAPADHFTLEWLIGSLPRHSFGFILFFLTLIEFLPVISFVSGVLIIILTIQIICGYHKPVLPRRFMVWLLPSKYLTRLTRYVVPALKRLEKIVRPRWTVILKDARRITAFLAMLVTLLSLLAPLPLSNVPPSVIGILMALSYIEHDGLVLLLALFSAFAWLAFMSWLFLYPFLA